MESDEKKFWEAYDAIRARLNLMSDAAKARYDGPNRTICVDNRDLSEYLWLKKACREVEYVWEQVVGDERPR